ncbi:MAG: endonuclease III, partial [Thermoanaerobaculia bacterium]
MPPGKPVKVKPPNAAAKNSSKRKRRRGAELKAHALEVLKRLKKEYPDAHCELDFDNPLQLLVATILSAQCT